MKHDGGRSWNDQYSRHFKTGQIHSPLGEKHNEWKGGDSRGGGGNI